jgi:hypothetical protein
MREVYYKEQIFRGGIVKIPGGGKVCHAAGLVYDIGNTVFLFMPRIKL